MRLSIFPIVIILVSACNYSKSKKREQPTASEKITALSFDTEMHNFGKLESGEIVIFSFVFTNTGENNLYLKNAKTDCGCVSAHFTKNPVKPGKKGAIEVEFDSAGLFGNQFKTIIVEANVPEPKHLAIFAQVYNEQFEIQY